MKRVQFSTPWFSLTHLARPFFCLLVAAFGAVASAQDFSSVQFSEFLINAPGFDNGREFIELSGPAGASLTGLFIIEIEGDGSTNGSGDPGTAGRIDGVFDLSGLTLGSNGLLLLRDEPTIDIDQGEGNPPLTVPATLQPAPSPQTNVFAEGESNTDPGMGPVRALFRTGTSGIENGSVTLALVSGFIGAIGDSVDAEGAMNEAGETIGDGILDDNVLGGDTPLIGGVLDAIGIDENGPVSIIDIDGGSFRDDYNVAFGEQLGGFDINGNAVVTLPGFGPSPDGFVRLNDGNGGVINAVFDGDEFNFDDNFRVFVDQNGNQVQDGNEVVINTENLGPFAIDNAFDPTPVESIDHDFNGDLAVNAADFVVARDSLGQTPSNLENDTSPTDVSLSDIEDFIASFGSFTTTGDDIPEIIGIDANGDYFVIDPEEIGLTPAFFGLPEDANGDTSPDEVIISTDFGVQPANLFLLSPGNVNGTGSLTAMQLFDETLPGASASSAAVPEPISVAMLLAAASSVGVARYRP